MVNVLVLSSWVAYGHVGLSVAEPILQALRHRVTGLPTTLLSNHPAWQHNAGAHTDPALLRKMIDAIDANGWLATQEALFTGYLPTPAHVRVACELADKLSTARIVVDPVLGDDPGGLYMPSDAASAIRDELLARADVLTPNRFELSWLTGRTVDTLEDARAAAETLLNRVGTVLVTSPPIDPFDTGVLAVTEDGATLYRTSHHAGIPNGTGDAFASLIAAGLPVGTALGHVHSLTMESRGAEHLCIAESAATWTKADPIPPTEPPWPSPSS